MEAVSIVQPAELSLGHAMIPPQLFLLQTLQDYTPGERAREGGSQRRALALARPRGGRLPPFPPRHPLSYLHIFRVTHFRTCHVTIQAMISLSLCGPSHAPRDCLQSSSSPDPRDRHQQTQLSHPPCSAQACAPTTHMVCAPCPSLY